MRLNLAGDLSTPEPSGDGVLRDVGRFAEPGLVPCFDLIAQRCSLAVRHCGNPCRPGGASRSQGIHGWCRDKAAVPQILLYGCDVVVAMGRPRQEARGVVGKDRLERSRNDVGKFILLDSVLYVE